MSEHKIPAIIVTGFLGSGKTTLIKHVMAHAGSRRIALIVNEFGEVGIDGDLLKGCGDASCSDIVELANGCICCTVADDFLPTMMKLLERDEPPDHIIIETSGLALPQPLVRAFGWPQVRARVTVDGVIAVVDADALAGGRFAHDEQALNDQRLADEALDHDSPIRELFEDQIAAADIILLNKADLVTADTLADLEKDLRTHAREGVCVIRSEAGRVDVTSLFGLDMAAEDDLDNRRSHHELAGLDDHDHDDFESLVVDMGSFPSRPMLERRILQAVRAHDILRVKGFVALDDAESRLVAQAAGPRFDSYFDRPWTVNEPRRSHLVIIGRKGLDRQAIEVTLTG